MKEVLSSSYKIEIISDDNNDVYSLITKDFSIFYNREEDYYFITFRVGLVGRRVGELMKLISLIFSFEEYTVIDDCYFDHSENKLIFGDEALEKKQEEINKHRGKQKCPICDGVYDKKYFKHGFCLNCDEIKDSLIWC